MAAVSNQQSISVDHFQLVHPEQIYQDSPVRIKASKDFTSSSMIRSAISVHLESGGSMTHDIPAGIGAPQVTLVAQKAIQLGMQSCDPFFARGDVTIFAPKSLSITTPHLFVGRVSFVNAPQQGKVSCERLTFLESTNEKTVEAIKSYLTDKNTQIELQDSRGVVSPLLEDICQVAPFAKKMSKSFICSGIVSSEHALFLESDESMIYRYPAVLKAPRVSLGAEKAIYLGMNNPEPFSDPVQIKAPQYLSITTPHLSVGELTFAERPKTGMISCKKLTFLRSTKEETVELIKSLLIRDDTIIEVVDKDSEPDTDSEADAIASTFQQALNIDSIQGQQRV